MIVYLPKACRTGWRSAATEARGTGSPQKTNDLVREAVGCMGLLAAFDGERRDILARNGVDVRL